MLASKKMKLIYCDALLIHLAYSKKAHRTHQQTIEILHCSLRVCGNYRLRENQSQGEKKRKKITTERWGLIVLV